MKAECRRLKTDRSRRHRRYISWVSLFIIHHSSFIFAQPSQSEVLRSIGENIDNQTGGPTRVLALMIAALGLALLLLVLSYRRKREVAPRAINHPGKLLREVSRSMDLKPPELRQLKLLAEKQSLASPLTLLLCPSLLSKAVREHPTTLDRKLISSIARKIAHSQP